MTGPTDLAAARTAKATRNGAIPPADDTEIWPSPATPLKVADAVAPVLYTSDGVHTMRRWRNGWVTWDPSGAWLDREDDAVEKDMYDLLRDAVCYREDKDGFKLVPWAPSRAKVGDVLHALGRSVLLLPAGVDVPAWLGDGDHPPAGEMVACRNGLLHVTTRELLDHTPEFFTRTAVPFDFDPDAPEPTRWLGFLESLWGNDGDMIGLLREWFGYVLSGRTDLHKIALLVGATRGGKGAISRVLGQLVGEANSSSPTLDQFATNFGLSPLIGKPLAVIGDGRVDDRDGPKLVSRLLSISGGDAINIDVKYSKPWGGRLPTRFMLLSNEVPKLVDSSGAMAGRFVVLKFTESFLGREDKTLEPELALELPGILNWALDGLDVLTSQGHFTEPEASADAVDALARVGSAHKSFVMDRCVVGHDAEVSKRRLFVAWRRWCEETGDAPGTDAEFGKALRGVLPRVGSARHMDSSAGKQVPFYVGVGLRDDETESNPGTLGSMEGASW